MTTGGWAQKLATKVPALYDKNTFARIVDDLTAMISHRVKNTDFATAADVGVIKPDTTTITVDADGTAHAVDTVTKAWQPQGYWKTPLAFPNNEIFGLPTKVGHKLPINMSGSIVGFETAPAADWTATFYNGAVSIGSVTVAAGLNAGVITFAAEIDFTGDLFKFIGPAVADASASGLYFLFVGTRTQ